MPDIFTDAEERSLVVNQVATNRGLAPWLIEKDLWVCWTLARLQEIDGVPNLTFKGGTSLSKVHGLIHRFSEDIDLTFSRDGWGFDGDRDPLRKGLSGKKRQKLIKEITKHAETIVREDVVPRFRAACRSRLPAGWAVDIDDNDSQAIEFTFPTPAVTYGYCRPIVKVEFGARGDPWPTSPNTIRPYIEEDYAGMASSAIVKVAALNPERTFWEKVTLLHGLHHATLAKPDKNIARLSRHIYDVHCLWHTATLREKIVDPSLLLAVVENKMVFFQDPKSRYELVKEWKLTCEPHKALAETLRKDFRAMASMFFANAQVPTFDEALGALGEVDTMVASWKGSANGSV